jgi:DNA-binding CsgD family transcriptional regulator
VQGRAVKRVVNDPLAEARKAIARADWQGALDAGGDVTAFAGDSLSLAEHDAILAEALWWLGRLDECIARRAAAYRTYEELGERRQAGQCAVWLYEHYCFKAQPAIASGWLQRARRALDGDPECSEHGALALREAEAAHGRGQLDQAAVVARQTVDLARRLESTDLEAEALQTLARVLIDLGRVQEGLAHFDEAMLFAIEGRLGPYSTGKVYCSLISACEELGDLSRAAEWTDATSRWACDHPFAVFPGICRVHRASALSWRGQLALAETEATKACAELVTIHLPNAGAAFAEVGDIRRRLGDLVGAEAAFAKSEELCGRTCPGVALLRLAQGHTDAAVRIITGCLRDAAWNRLARARMLPAHVQISIAAGDLATAKTSADELDAIAVEVDTTLFHAFALLARGRVLLAEQDHSGAAVRLRDALALWKALGVPYEVASTATLLGHALRQGGDDEAARASFTAAGALFEEIGARLDARLTRDFHSVARAPAGLTAREVDVLQLLAAGHTNKDIASHLFLSQKTVSRHLSNIFAKLGVSSRSGATAFAFEHHVVGRR